MTSVNVEPSAPSALTCPPPEPIVFVTARLSSPVVVTFVGLGVASRSATVGTGGRPASLVPPAGGVVTGGVVGGGAVACWVEMRSTPLAARQRFPAHAIRRYAPDAPAGTRTRALALPLRTFALPSARSSRLALVSRDSARRTVPFALTVTVNAAPGAAAAGGDETERTGAAGFANAGAARASSAARVVARRDIARLCQDVAPPPSSA